MCSLSYRALIPSTMYEAVRRCLGVGSVIRLLAVFAARRLVSPSDDACRGNDEDMGAELGVALGADPGRSEGVAAHGLITRP